MGEFYLGMLPPIDNWEDYQSGFRLNIDEMTQVLQNRWTDIVVSINDPRTHFLLAWDIGKFPGHILFTGHVQTDLQTLVLSPGPKQIFLDFVLWYRNYIASIQQLFLYSSWSSNYAEITPQTTGADIVLFTQLEN